MKGSYNRFLEFIDCDNVTLDGVTLHNSTTWQVVPINTNNIRINNIKIISDQASDDGIDVGTVNKGQNRKQLHTNQR
jgi:polygalacturonase